MYVPKFLKIFTRNYGKLKDFTISVIAGLFSGLGIGIFFDLTTDITFNRWINLKSYEAFAAFIYVIFFFLILIIFYGFGMFITSLMDKKRTLGFHLNFVAGIYSSTMTFLLVLYFNQPATRYTIAGIGIVFFFILAYYTIKKKWSR